MKRLFLMGRSESGKTSLTQALKGEELHYHKTQYTNTAEDTIDTRENMQSPKMLVLHWHVFHLRQIL